MKETKAGAPYKLFQMEDGKRLSVFQFDTRYAEITEGIDIPDDALIYDQQYDNYKLKPLPKPAGSPRGGFGSKQAEELINKKNDNIQQNMASKNEAIIRAGSARDATLVSLACLKDAPFPTDSEYKAEWEKWYKYFMGKAEEPFA